MNKTIYDLRKLILLSLAIGSVFWQCTSSEGKDVWQLEMDAFINDLLGKMTLEEKAGQLTLYTSGWTVTGPELREDYKEEMVAGRAGNLFNAHTVSYARELQRIAVEETRLGIPLLFGLDVIHGYKTTFPIPLAESCSWDLELIENSARLSAKEAASAGINWTFNPMVDVARDPRWGRVAEGAGEDTYLTSLIGVAKVRGYQGADLADPTTILACVKHFAAYGAAQAGRDYHTVDMSDRVLRETYLPPYKAALDAGATTFMTSFNELDGIPASGNRYLMTDILRGEWGFKGFVVTDYTAINEMVAHGVVANEKEAAELAFNAGVEMDMQGGLYSKYLPDLVAEGKVERKRLDDAVRKILKMKYKLGLFQDPYRYLSEERETSTLHSDELMQAVLESARESIVLLKNERVGSKPLLPISKEVKSIALIGPLADNQKDLLGTWHVAGDASKVVTVKQGIEQLVPQAKIQYAEGVGFTGKDQKKMEKAVEVARKSEVVIMVLGENYQQSGEAASRSALGLPGHQQGLLKAIQALGKPLILLTMSGRPLTLSWEQANIPAILHCWHLGTMAGQAIAETLFGDNNPSGKLTMTFPRNVGQVPIYYNMKNTGRPFDDKNKYTSKYIDVSNEPLYVFGHGLSYAEFEYSDLTLSNSELTAGSTIEISANVRNSSQVPGEEIVQLYLCDVVGSVTRPVKELRGFRKIKLAGGEKKRVTFGLKENDLRFYTRSMEFRAEPGKFKVFVGSSSNAELKGEFVLTSDPLNE
ncbi:MAG: beta-glucosidase BglX [Cyclobacteriaceae bacterium]|nr:beta-glucosidase BglX [Cyclobacteriaceae bacterium HetDA_MAG_MS6]